MPIVNRQLKKARSLGLPNISWRNLSKCCRTKLKQFEKNEFEKYVTPSGVFFYKDNGSDILAVASLDVKAPPLHTSTLSLHDDVEFYCPSIGNRIGVYAIVDYLPQLFKNNVYDILLVTGSNKLQSSARYFKPPLKKRYKWAFSLDAEGGNAATYQYFDVDTARALLKAGWAHTNGVYSDIIDLEHLRCKMFSFGIGTYDTHKEKAFLSRNGFMQSIMKFNRFWRENRFKALPHTPIYNAYIIGKGFMYYEDRDYPKIFTSDEMDLIELLEEGGYELEDWNTQVFPEDIPELVLAYQKMISDEGYLREMEKYKNSQGKLFSADHFEKMHNRVEHSGSEDSPEFVKNNYHNKYNNPNSEFYDPDGFDRYTRFGDEEKEPRKARSMMKTSNDVVVTVQHKPKSEIKVEEIENGFETTLADICSTCHTPFDSTIGSKETQCTKCRREKPKKTNIIKLSLRRRRPGEIAYDFDETKQNWFETGEAVGITRSKSNVIPKRPKEVAV